MMSRLNTQRSVKIDTEFTKIEKSLAQVASGLTRDTSLVINLCGWMHDNITTNKGDFDNDDRADLNAKFAPIMQEIQTQLGKLAECYAVYDDDPAVYANNLAAFIAKYPSADPAEVDKRFS
jgi:hypothetical protein